VIDPVLVRETEVEALRVGVLEGLLLWRGDWVELRETIKLFVFTGDMLYVSVSVKMVEPDTVSVFNTVIVAVA